jgi:endonuclease III
MVRKKLTNHQAVAHSPPTLTKIQMVRRGATLEGEHQVFGAAYRLLDPDTPAPTVTRSGFRDFIHPDEDRLCTVRELARLQTFPDSYAFSGRRCDTYAKSRYVQQTQHEQVGNAVPPMLARVVARAIRTHLFSKPQWAPSSRNFERIFDTLDALYPVCNLGNKSNPVDELVYIMLSRRAREQQYQAIYSQLKQTYRSWDSVLKASESELARLLQPLGLAQQRSRSIKAVLAAIHEDFGKISLTALRRWDYSAAYHYLTALPGVNDKTAKCVMMYSLGFPMLPVDTHTLRVSARLGLVPANTTLFKAPRLLDSAVPRRHRSRYHILTVLHGRAVCIARRPKCAACPVARLCPSRASTA